MEAVSPAVKRQLVTVNARHCMRHCLHDRNSVIPFTVTDALYLNLSKSGRGPPLGNMEPLILHPNQTKLLGPLADADYTTPDRVPRSVLL